MDSSWGNFEYGSEEYAEATQHGYADVYTGTLTAETVAELLEVLGTQSASDLDFQLITDPVLGFASEWVHQKQNLEDTAAFSITFAVNYVRPFDVRVQYDRNGDGTADKTIGPIEMFRENQTISTQDLGDEGWYRVIISGLRPSNKLLAVSWGPTRY